LYFKTRETVPSLFKTTNRASRFHPSLPALFLYARVA
jgi:hypothetical protein